MAMLTVWSALCKILLQLTDCTSFLSVYALIHKSITTICALYFLRFLIIMAQMTGSVVHICRRAVSFHSMNSTTNSTPHKPQQLHHRNSPSPNYRQHRSSNLAEVSPAIPYIFFIKTKICFSVCFYNPICSLQEEKKCYFSCLDRSIKPERHKKEELKY